VTKPLATPAASKELARLDALIAQKEKATTNRAAEALVAGFRPM
jgi:hypothetical protein